MYPFQLIISPNFISISYSSPHSRFAIDKSAFRPAEKTIFNDKKWQNLYGKTAG
ncbi:hypothetical protein [Neisseria sp.]|uniref:hypothetical protein n=1 Tax=Neisseria sp. TaxID=192066 RepID=UPI00289EE933|nr:hypothetical protein [Neisseria sp.]